MALQKGLKIQGTPRNWLAADLDEFKEITDPAKQYWSKDTGGAEAWWYDSSQWRGPGQVSTALVLHNINWEAAFPTNAEILDVVIEFTRFLRGSQGQLNDVRDHVLAPTLPVGGGGNTPKPDVRDYSNATQWAVGYNQPASFVVLDTLTLRVTDTILTPTDYTLGGFGFMYAMKSGSGKVEGGGGGEGNMGIIDPKIVVTYNVETP